MTKFSGGLYVFTLAAALVCMGCKGNDVSAPDPAKASITIQGPQDEDISIAGFVGDSPVLSRSGKGPAELSVSVGGDYASCAWYINGVEKSADAGHDNQITLNASAYPLKSHYLTVVVYKTDIPYSREFTFTVVE
jgi:hypothetical protein